MNWQPIDTAPKDGTVILVATFRFVPDVSSANWNGAYWDMRFMDDYDGPYDSQYEREFGQPTHWMPPPPPLCATLRESYGWPCRKRVDR